MEKRSRREAVFLQKNTSLWVRTSARGVGEMGGIWQDLGGFGVEVSLVDFIGVLYGESFFGATYEQRKDDPLFGGSVFPKTVHESVWNTVVPDRKSDV